MKFYEAPFALLAFLAFVAIAPAWMFFINDFNHSLSLEATFLAGLVLPATSLLFLASWLQPG